MPDELRRIGAQMANVMYNLAQRLGEPLSPEYVKVMDDLRKQWDAAAGASQTATPAAAQSNSATDLAPSWMRAVRWEALGYVAGATVRQRIAPGQYEDAVIVHAHGNGALDVQIDGKKTYGWSAAFCEVIIEPLTKPGGG